jgi:CDP-paratose 2-epimerase
MSAANLDLETPAITRTRPIIVTGGAGFIGSNLADRLASEGEDILVVDSLERPGVEANLAWLKRNHPRQISSIRADVRDPQTAEVVNEASAVFHFAAQVAVTTSLASPLEDLDTNVRGTTMLLEAVRKLRSRIPFIFASTNKVYGNLAHVPLEIHSTKVAPADPQIREFGINESQRLDFHTPYGCSKGAADQYVLDYARTFHIPATVLRMSCIYGPRQCGTEDQGWVAHFLIRSHSGKPITIFGDGRQVRDVLHVADAVEAYVRAHRNIESCRGQAFNLGGGPCNAVSLLDVIDEIARMSGSKPVVRHAPARPSDQRFYISDTRKISAAFGLPTPRPWRNGLAHLAHWIDSDARDFLRSVRNEPAGINA